MAAVRGPKKPRPPLRPAAPVPLPSAQVDPSRRRMLWWLVAGTTVIIVLIWVAVVGVNLSRTADGERSLYDRIKQEIQSVFGKSDSAKNSGTLTNDELDELERRVFPNVNVTDTGTFIAP